MYEYNIVSLWHTPDRTFLGSAIRLTADHILTAGHLLDKLEPTPDTLFVGLLPELRRRPPARIVEINKALDTMILRLDETPPGVFLKPAFQRRPIKAKAQQVKLMAADPESTLDPPREFDWGRHAILVSGSHTIASHRQGHYVITSDSYRGSSGGGVVLEGKLLGMILSRAENDPLGYALSIEQAIEWIMQVIPGFTVRDAEAEAVLCATIFAKIRRSLDISYMHPLRDTFDFDSDAQGSPERVATRLLGSFAQAIKAARPWMLDPRGGGDRNSMQQVCRQIVVWLYRLGIYDDAVLANSKRFKGNQLDQVAPCESAAALEFLRAVAVGGPRSRFFRLVSPRSARLKHPGWCHWIMSRVGWEGVPRNISAKRLSPAHGSTLPGARPVAWIPSET